MDGELGSTLPSFAAIAPFSPYKSDKVGIIICSRHYTTTGAAYELPEYKLISLLSRHSLFCPSPSPQLSSRPLFTYLWWRHLSREENTLASEMRLWRKYRKIAGSVSLVFVKCSSRNSSSQAQNYSGSNCVCVTFRQVWFGQELKLFNWSVRTWRLRDSEQHGSLAEQL